jgi:hypothetical protein
MTREEGAYLEGCLAALHAQRIFLDVLRKKVQANHPIEVSDVERIQQHQCTVEQILRKLLSKKRESWGVRALKWVRRVN